MIQFQAPNFNQRLSRLEQQQLDLEHIKPTNHSWSREIVKVALGAWSIQSSSIIFQPSTSFWDPSSKPRSVWRRSCSTLSLAQRDLSLLPSSRNRSTSSVSQCFYYIATIGRLPWRSHHTLSTRFREVEQTGIPDKLLRLKRALRQVLGLLEFQDCCFRYPIPSQCLIVFTLVLRGNEPWQEES